MTDDTLDLFGNARPQSKKPHSYWTEVRIRSAAQHFRTIDEFRKGEPGAYDAARRKGLIDTLGFVRLAAKRRSDDEIRAIAKSFASVPEFRQRAPKVYDIASKRGILRELTKRMPRKRTEYSGDDELIAIARRFETCKDLLAFNSPVYHAIQGRGLLDVACRHMRRLGNKHMRQVYRMWNDDNEVYIGLSFDWKARHRGHHRRPASNLRNFMSKPHRIEPLTELMSPDEAGKAEAAFIERFRSDGWIVLNKARAGALGGIDRTWSNEALADEAKRHATRSGMLRANKLAYDAAVKRKIIDLIFAEHPNRGYASASSARCGAKKSPRLPRGHWTETTIAALAKRFQTRSQMMRNASGAYEAALRLGVLEKVFSDHANRGLTPDKKPHTYWQTMSDDDIIAIARQHGNRTAMARAANLAYKEAHRRGLLDGVIAKLPTRQKATKA